VQSYFCGPGPLSMVEKKVPTPFNIVHTKPVIQSKLNHESDTYSKQGYNVLRGKCSLNGQKRNRNRRKQAKKRGGCASRAGIFVFKAGLPPVRASLLILCLWQGRGSAPRPKRGLTRERSQRALSRHLLV
jgi:hypothetical protein